MVKLRERIVGMRQVASRISAACLLCALLVLGLLWPVPVSFAAEKDAAASEAAAEAAVPEVPAGDVGNVMVEAPSDAPAPSGPQSQPESEPIAPDAPIVPEYERAWPIGADDASAVLAELWPDGTFVVDGSGETVAFDDVKDVPWLAAGVADDIKRVIFADKVEATSLAHWFEGCSNLSEIANVPASVEDLTRAFYDCPKLVELPDEFAFADEAVADECFGFGEPAETLLATVYRGADENVLGYAWNLDGRELVNPDAPELPTVEEPDDSAEPKDPVESETPEDSEDVEVTDDSKDLDASADESAEQPADELADKLATAPAEEAPRPRTACRAGIRTCARTPRGSPGQHHRPLVGFHGSERRRRQHCSHPRCGGEPLGTQRGHCGRSSQARRPGLAGGLVVAHHRKRLHDIRAGRALHTAGT